MLTLPEKHHTMDNLIPMINIIFLLLIFFMVAGVMKSYEPIEVTPPKVMQENNSSTSLPIDIWLSADGTAFLADTAMDLETLTQRIIQQSTTDSKLRIKADKALPAEKLLTLLQRWQPSSHQQVELILH